MRHGSTRLTRLLAALVVAATACTSESPSGPDLSPKGSIGVTASSNDVVEGDVLSVHAVVRDASGREIPAAPVTWSSADTTVALVSVAGQVTALRPGAARITARSSGLTGDLTLTIQPLKVSQVSLLGLPDTLGSGDISPFGVRVQGPGGRDIVGREVKLASSNSAVALIDPSGRVRAVAPGTATVSATVDGVAGTTPVVVSAEPAELHLRRSDGKPVPALVEGDSGLFNGAVEYREIYLESGLLHLTGGAQPGYQTTLHYAWYVVTFDANGQRHFVFKSALDMTDHGSVHYDSHGDLVMTSEAESDISHDASVETGGFTMRYRFLPNQLVPPSAFFFRREPK
ncbi:MAG: Ig-like domain-containing protein [bacterium]